MTKKLPLKTLEKLIEVQAVNVSLAELGRHNGLFPAAIDDVVSLSTETLAGLLGEYTRRTNSGRTEKLMKRVAGRLQPEAAQ